MQQLATIEPGTHPSVRDRIPEIIQLIHEDNSVQEIADRLGIHRSTVWRSLQRVDFKPVVNLLINDILSEIDLIDNADKRVWSRIQLVKALHSKKTSGELTVTQHTINEERRTARLELDLLSPDEQRTLIELQRKMRGPKQVEAEQTAEP